MARDIYHYAVKEALLKDGWTITHDPFPLNITNFNMEVDLAAEQIFQPKEAKNPFW